MRVAHVYEQSFQKLASRTLTRYNEHYRPESNDMETNARELIAQLEYTSGMESMDIDVFVETPSGTYSVGHVEYNAESNTYSIVVVESDT